MKIFKLKYSKIIPLDGFYAITVFGYLIRRTKYKDTPIPPTTMNHEGIHACQAGDFLPDFLSGFFLGFLGYIIFYLLYFIEWLIKLFISIFTGNNAYYSISFEQEAYLNQDNLNYQDTRKRFAWIKYIFKMV